MIHRPVDASGDILPVLSSSGLLRGAEAVARLVEERLSLYAGDWWENSGWGNGILQMLRESRLTEADGRALASYLAAYIRETPGVQEIRDTAYSVDGRRFSFSCTVDTEDGMASVGYSF